MKDNSINALEEFKEYFYKNVERIKSSLDEQEKGRADFISEYPLELLEEFFRSAVL